MNQLVDRLLNVFDQHNDAYHLDASAGGARTTTDHHHQNRRDEEETPPGVVVVVAALEARVRQQGHHMEQRSTDTLPPRLRVRGQLLLGDSVEVRGKIETAHKQQGENKDGQQIPTQLLVAPNHIEATREQEMVHGEVDARHQHENHTDALDIVGLEIADAGLMRAEATRGNGREGMAHGIELVHGTQVIEEGTQQRQCDVDDPQ